MAVCHADLTVRVVVPDLIRQTVLGVPQFFTTERTESHYASTPGGKPRAGNASSGWRICSPNPSRSAFSSPLRSYPGRSFVPQCDTNEVQRIPAKQKSVYTVLLDE